jgi:glycosyltransferase involved in cell wall biosynthesis
MNILIINDFSFVNGGASQVAILSAIGLASSGYGVTYFSAVGPPDPRLAESGVEVVCLGQSEILQDSNRVRAAVWGIWNLPAKNGFDKILNNFDPSNTIIHLHSWTKALSSSVVRVAIQRRFKIVVTMHDYFLSCPNGSFLNYQQSVICKRDPLSIGCCFTDCDSRNYLQKCWRLLRQLVQQRFGMLPGSIKHFIAVSSFSKDILRPFLPGDATLHQVNNPVSVMKTSPVKVSENNTYIFVGRLSKEKGCLLFAEAALRLSVKATFIGGGELTNQVLDIYPEAHVTGWLPQDKMQTYLDSARAMVFPTLWYEGQGLSVIEALARGIPVILSDTSASREMVRNGISGLWFKRGDLQDLIEKMRQMSDPEFAKRMGKVAYEDYWSSPCTLERHIKELECCYSRILGQAKG